MRYLHDLPPDQAERLAQVTAEKEAREMAKPGNASKAEAKRFWRNRGRRTVDCELCGRMVVTKGMTRCLKCRRGW